MDRIVLISDAHLEPGVPFDPSYIAVKRFIKDIKPTHSVILGDFGDFGCFCRFDQNKRLMLEGKRYHDNITIINQELDEIQEDSDEVLYTLGNHEYRVYRYIQEHAELFGALDLVRDLNLDGRGIEWCDYNGVLSVGKLNFTHGFRTNQHHAKATAMEFGDHIFYGHTHDHQVYTPHFRIDRQPYAAVSCGCLCSKNPEYLEGRPSRWINGFVYIEMREDESFNHHWLAITDGRFSFGGQTWDGN